MHEAPSRRFSLGLLDVPVEVVCDDPALGERLAICYARSFRPEREHGGLGGGLTAELRSTATGWRTVIDERDDRELEDPIEAVRAFNHELMHAVMLRRRELYYVHAAVVEWHRSGILMPGLSQAGKSTLALAFVEAGARFASDELLAYDRTRRVARAFPRAPKIRDVCVGYFPGREEAFVGTGEGRFLPFDAGGIEVAEETRVRIVLLPRWDPEVDGVRLEPVSAGKALLELAASSLNFGTHRTQSLDFLTDLVSGARAYGARWSDPHAVVRAVAEAEELA